MHLLQAKPGEITDGSEAVDLQQTPADIVILSAADTDLSSLASAHADFDDAPSLRLANLMQLGHPMSMDLYVEQTLASSRLIIARVLGGVGYWSYGIEQLQALARERGIRIALLPGDDQPDPELMARSTLPAADCHRLWQYLVHGGRDNAAQLLRFASSVLGADCAWLEPAPLARAGLHWPSAQPRNVDDLRRLWKLEDPHTPTAAIIFYRSVLQAGSTAPVDGLVDALARVKVNAMPIFCTSLKDAACADTIASLLDEAAVDLVINATGFSLASPGGERKTTPFDYRDCPVLQVVFSGGSEANWRDGNAGLSARDIAMNVALPEVDGRLTTRAVSFKSAARRDPHTQCDVVHYQALPDRIDFVAQLARRWIALRRQPRAERRIAIVLANYPTRDGRIGNGVGLDTPAATVCVLNALAKAGYAVSDVPENGNALIARLQSGPTNSMGSANGSATVRVRTVRHWLSRDDYQRGFSKLPAALREQLTQRWGAPEEDPFFDAHEQAFAIPAFCCGAIIIGLQPARGYHIDPVRSYHDPALIPPHGYLAFYIWLNEVREVHAIAHMGKHGNLEWLPGKSLALSQQCWPEAVLGPVPHLYPFIVNDPGEGTQAKRRSQAVIVDHLTPPLTRAESYGPLADLEQLVDEYYEAAGVDPRRIALLREQILQLARRVGLDKDCGVADADDDDTALGKLDNHLCELKELQIRDGLHVFGISPAGDQLTDLLVALTRLPRGDGVGANASLIRALAADLELSDFDPLDCHLADPWHGRKPHALHKVLADAGSWRTAGDTVERLEALARALVGGKRVAEPAWNATSAVLEQIETRIRADVLACGARELDGLLAGFDGRFVTPGPSGAPTRGRTDVLPTGRNFYSIDTRTVPTPAAWTLGWHSAELLVEQYRQDHGEWPQRMALSAWGTANMRTGGDDIAQALALMGVQPTWEVSSRRVTGFEIMPLDLLDRPRVDVTLRISGFFRDAFPAQIALFDSAARAVADLDEEAERNPLAARVAQDRRELIDAGVDAKSAKQRAGFRVFGSQPGAYGAGLQALIDERGWQSTDDLARAYVAWGGYAYGNGSQGNAEHGLFERRLAGVQAVLHNQDNREHDLLDSDDYYQFEGGMTAAVSMLAQQRPKVYHNDHSRPERPVIRSLEEEIGRVVRARVVNPKWIDGVMRHGYKGAFEMAATVDYLFAFSATTGAVGDHHFDAVYEAYLEDDRVREFLEKNNPAALSEIAQRLLEAQERGLWTPRSNSAHVRLNALQHRGSGLPR